MKNPHCHSAAGEESPVFIFKTKIKIGDPLALQSQDGAER
ncbi:hypothetical protein SULYE_1497 [Sulfurihydrogenibium yellowstonense SS-5]|uniref:Uncharacterized protein n=1 Tax=Sulfurihydrogenibium yellowstonense SS-5 TaxID=432331 RepID=C4FLP3_9AQUI|nr:hypothetical protein SULYE_1497 [Sulfurihydrogenibium yellowstonense SS-5]